MYLLSIKALLVQFGSNGFRSVVWISPRCLFSAWQDWYYTSKFKPVLNSFSFHQTSYSVQSRGRVTGKIHLSLPSSVHLFCHYSKPYLISVAYRRVVCSTIIYLNCFMPGNYGQKNFSNIFVLLFCYLAFQRYNIISLYIISDDKTDCLNWLPHM